MDLTQMSWGGDDGENDVDDDENDDDDDHVKANAMVTPLKGAADD